MPSPTAVAAEALRKGVDPGERQPTHAIPGEQAIAGGDDEADLLGATYVGDEAPGGSMSAPDHDQVDEVGRAIGVQEVDSGALRTTSELMDERDRKRALQEEPEQQEP